MRYLLSLFNIGCLLFGGLLWAAPPFDEVVITPHNLLPSPGRAGFKNVCLSCHTDGQVLKQDPENLSPDRTSAPGGEPQTADSLSSESMQVSPATPSWNPGNRDHGFSLISALWAIEGTADRKPFGSSSACLGCHDGALAGDVHGADKPQEPVGTAAGRFLDHPIAIPYPRKPDGVFATEQPTPASQRYWSIADRTLEGVAMPSGPVSIAFRLPGGVDSKDPVVAASVVRTSYGIIHCDSCHNPHVNQYSPFLRTPPRDLCFVCHDR